MSTLYFVFCGHEVHVFEKNEKAGGMLVYGIPSFKLEKDVVQAEIDVIKAMGVEDVKVSEIIK